MSAHDKNQMNEQLSGVINSFLKKRKYTESAISVKDFATEQKMEEMAFKTTVCNESGIPNLFSFAINSSDLVMVDEHYTGFKSFITGTNQPYRQELSKFLFPMFANIYLDLVAKGQTLSAQTFFAKHSGDFPVEHKEEIQHLQVITDLECLKSSDTASNFRRSKFVIKLSNKVFTYFLQYLRSGDHVLLLHLLNKHFSIEISHNKPGKRPNGDEMDTEEAEHSGSGHRATKGAKQVKPAAEKTNENLVTLRESIGQVRSGPACLPSVCFYSFLNAHQGLSSAAISKDASLLCGGFEDSSVVLWSLTPKKLLHSKSKPEISKIQLSPGLESSSSKLETVSSEYVTLQGHSGPVYNTCFSSDNSILLSSSEDTSVRLWSLHSYTNVVAYKGHNFPVWGLDISPQCHYFATGSQDRTARLWNFEYTFPLRIFAGHLQDVDCVKFHHNCTYLATASSDRTCRLWDLQSGNCVRLFTGHKGSVYDLAMSSDGQYLVSAGEDRRILLWDLSAGSMIRELRGHTDTVYSLAFSADGTLLASGGLDNSVRIWDFGQAVKSSSNNIASVNASPEQMASFSAKNCSVHCVQFSSCNLILSAGSQTT
ncbi:TAF5-like RNA polymerase II p300/CBP-associated factor-associated factor 65 kDa subunit 5L [Montipora capricornis]|uniref:TAF5-like RNA polymerase II p300/CBP-associated factor-associated factor 65 kDa subunit 5L n=1 Tax=Montipora capricornis TaxID=246305 RepID=UPI0035F1C79A